MLSREIKQLLRKNKEISFSIRCLEFKKMNLLVYITFGSKYENEGNNLHHLYNFQRKDYMCNQK